MSYTYGKYDTIPGLSVSGDLSASQYMVVKAASTANGVIANDATTASSQLGVLIDAPDAAGEAATVANAGVVTMVSGTSVASYGTDLGFDTTGRAVDGNALVKGKFLEAPSAIGDLIKVSINFQD